MRYRLAYLLVTSLVFFSCIKERPAGADLGVGDVVPDFEVTMNDGSSVSGQDLRQTPSCIVFFHTSCPDCQQVLPVIQELYDKYVDEGVAFALVSREEEDAAVSAYWTECGFSMPDSALPGREIYSLFAQTSVPRVYICEKGGVIKAIYTDDPVPRFEELDHQINSVCGSCSSALSCSR